MSDFDVIGSSAMREGWLQLRRRGIGSSDSPAILGLSPFASPLSVYVDKLGLSDEREQTEQQKWGLILEPHIVEEFARETGRTAEHRNDLLRSKSHPFMQATCDAVEQWMKPSVARLSASYRRASSAKRQSAAAVMW